jgi:hypothetical protein
MPVTKRADLIIPEILIDAVQGEFKGMNALMNSGAAIVNGSLPNTRGGDVVKIPYFNVLGELEDLASDEGGSGDPPALNPRKLTMSNDSSPVKHSGVAFETTEWAQMAAAYADPYGEAARQIREATERRADAGLIDAAIGTPLGLDVYNAGTPRYLDYDLMVDGKALWGDEKKDIAFAAVHSAVFARLEKAKDLNGLPLFGTASDGGALRVAGVTVRESDRVPVEFNTITATGTTPPTVTVTGYSKGAFSALRLEITTAGARGTAVFRYSFNGGSTWTSGVLTAATVNLQLNGVDTGLTVNFAVGSYAVDNVYVGTPKFSTLIVKKNALVFWFNKTPVVQTDKDILADTMIAATHVYWVAHMYSRMPGTTNPGVVRLRHN